VASLDKISAKDEVCRFKADFDRLSVEGKMSSETRAIMNSLFMIIELILLIFLSATPKSFLPRPAIPHMTAEKNH
jgi:transposase